MKTKIILVDMDGVICDYTKEMLDLAHSRFGFNHYKPEEVFEFYTERIFPEKHQDSVEALSLEEKFFLQLKPIPGALDAIKEMSTNPNISLWFCSSPKKKSPWCHSEKFLWLQQNLGQDFAERLILARDKTLVFGDVLIDDKLSIPGINKNPSWEHVIFDQPYNRSDVSKKRLTWSNWKEVLDVE